MKKMNLIIKTTEVDEKLVLMEFIGDMDACSHIELKRIFETLIEQSRYNLLVDLASVTHLGNVSLHSLLNCLKTMQEKKGILKLICSNESEVYNLIKITQTDKKFAVYNSRLDAIVELN